MTSLAPYVSALKPASSQHHTASRFWFTLSVNQNAKLKVTVRLSWDQPGTPPLGSFGAEAESAYGLRDVIYDTPRGDMRGGSTVELRYDLNFKPTPWPRASKRLEHSLERVGTH